MSGDFSDIWPAPESCEAPTDPPRLVPRRTIRQLMALAGVTIGERRRGVLFELARTEPLGLPPVTSGDQCDQLLPGARKRRIALRMVRSVELFLDAEARQRPQSAVHHWGNARAYAAALGVVELEGIGRRVRAGGHKGAQARRTGDPAERVGAFVAALRELGPAAEVQALLRKAARTTGDSPKTIRRAISNDDAIARIQQAVPAWSFPRRKTVTKK